MKHIVEELQQKKAYYVQIQRQAVMSLINAPKEGRYLRGYGEVFPDFILLNVKKRKEIVLEHFGMMDNANYCVKAIRKMGLYEKNDYYENDNLICSFETSFNILDTNLLERKIRRLAF